MKKKLALIPMVLVALMFSFTLVACGGPSDEELIRSDLEEYFNNSEDAAEDFASGLESAAGDDLDTLGIDETEFTKAYLDGFAFEVGDITVDGDAATAQVTVTIKQMGTIMTNFQSEFNDWVDTVDPSTIASESDLYKKGGEILIQVTKDTKPAETTVDLKYNKNDDGEWEMDSSSEGELVAAVIS